MSLFSRKTATVSEFGSLYFSGSGRVFFFHYRVFARKNTLGGVALATAAGVFFLVLYLFQKIWVIDFVSSFLVLDWRVFPEERGGLNLFMRRGPWDEM